MTGPKKPGPRGDSKARPAQRTDGAPSLAHLSHYGSLEGFSGKRSGKGNPGSGGINGYCVAEAPANFLGSTSDDVVKGFSPTGHRAKAIDTFFSAPLRTTLKAISSPGGCLSNSAKKPASVLTCTTSTAIITSPPTGKPRRPGPAGTIPASPAFPGRRRTGESKLPRSDHPRRGTPR